MELEKRKITYTPYFNKSGEFTIDLSHEEQTYDHEKRHVELLVDILNCDFAKSEWLEDKPFSFLCPTDCNYEDYIRDFKSFVGSDSIEKDIELHNKLKEQLYGSFDLSKYKNFVNSVFVDKRDGLSSYQLYVAYVLSNLDLGLGEFYYKVSMDSDIYLLANIEKDDALEIVRTNQGPKRFEKTKEYFKGKESPDVAIPVYEFINFDVFLRFLLYTMAINNEQINICKNCGSYFCPPPKNDTLYCSKKSPQDSTKTCREFEARKKYKENIKNSEAMTLFRKLYMQKLMRVKRNPEHPSYKKDLENFQKESTIWKKDVRKGLKSEAEYLTWLKSIREKGEA